MGLRARFVMIAGVIGAIALLLVGVASYKFSMNNAMNEAKDKGQIIFSYIDSSKSFFKEVQRPLIMELVEQDRFYPELMSPIAIVRKIYDRFSKTLPDFKFKQAALNPLLPANKADAVEQGIINTFVADKALKSQEGIIEKGGGEFYYFAEPMTVTGKGCLKCHGDPYDAPKDQAEIYGIDNGYGWKLGETVGTMVVYISLKEPRAAARSSATTLFLIGAGCLLVALLGIWFFLDKGVVGPIVHLCDRAEEISLGKNLEESIVATSKDEIGSLTKAVERLRVSMVRMLKRQKK